MSQEKKPASAVLFLFRRTLDQILGPVDEAGPVVPAAQGWGWLPVLSLIGATGLLLVSLADTGARSGEALAASFFWLGLLLLFTPIAIRLALPRVSRQERLGLVVFLGLGLYLIKFLHSPLLFSLHDEFFHWRTTEDILRTGRLFQENSLLPVSALYPGMEIVASALADLSGLPIFPIGVTLIGLARLILVLSLFLFFEQLSRSARTAGLAALFYMANPNFLFFLSIYKYESLALPFVALALFAIARREKSTGADSFAMTLVVLLAFGFVAISHHLTAYIFMGILILWSVITHLWKGRGDGFEPGRLSLLLMVENLAWLAFIASITVHYLAPHFIGAVQELLRVALGEAGAGRALFSSTIESENMPGDLIEPLIGYASAGLILLGLPLGLAQIFRRHRKSSLVLTMAVLTLAYPIGLILRFTRSGWEIANRSSEYVFLPLGLVLGVSAVEVLLKGRRPLVRTLAFGACASIIFLGGIIAGWPRDWRLPGPYQASVGPRSVEKQGLAAAEWVRSHLGLNNRMGADKVNMLLMGSYGGQHLSTTLSGGVDVPWILFAPEIETEQERLIRKGSLEYLVVDRRAFTDSQTASFYPGGTAEQALGKFERSLLISRLFDSGDIYLYDVGAISGAP